MALKKLATKFGFCPSTPDDGIKIKLDRLEQFLSGYVEVMDPNKKYGPQTEIITGEDGQKYAFVAGITSRAI